MTTFELYFCATLLRGALAVLFLLGAESLLRHRLSAGLRRLLWAGCILLLLVPQMNFSALPLKLDLSSLRTAGAAAAPARPSARTAGAGQPGIAPAENGRAPSSGPHGAGSSCTAGMWNSASSRSCRFRRFCFCCGAICAAEE